ncbi:hypothetical protein vseg_008397 [Gypsophila vaccaria]
MDGTSKFRKNDNGRAPTPRTKKKGKRKIKYVGWGSRELIDFLESIGKDTRTALSHYDVTNIVNQYVVDSKLIHPEKKKKRVICDERLQTLFGGKKQSVLRNKIYDLLEPHLLENHVESEDDSYSSDEEEDKGKSAASKRRKTSTSDKKPLPEKADDEVSKSALAAMSPENIKLAYLKRSLVQQLFLNEPRNFESKVVGSFVRIKADRYDIYQKNSYQLEVVTGVKKVAGDDNPPMLRLASTIDDINISALSEDTFSEEECGDLLRRVKEGFVKQPTVGELEEKVAMVHKDITRHFITRELIVLKNRADHANEKGLRHIVMECQDRRKLLLSHEEQSRLLNEIPKVLPEKVEVETTPDDSPDGEVQKPDDSPKDADWDWEPCYNSSAAASLTNTSSKGKGPHKFGTRSNIDSQPSSPEEETPSEIEQVRLECNDNSKLHDSSEIISHESEHNGHIEGNASNGDLKPKEVEVITLSDDEDEVEPPSSVASAHLDPECFAWYYLDPSRKVQGPFTLTTLKRWHGSGYFKSDFRIWASGQTTKQAVLLTDILRLVFHS